MTAAPSTPLDLDRLKELEKAATPGPWSDAHGELVHDWDSEGYVKLALSPCQNSPLKSIRRRHWDADRAFIASIRNAALALITAAHEAASLRAELEAMKTERDDFANADAAEIASLRAQLEVMTKGRAVGKVEGLTEAARDVIAERERQQSAEGWKLEHDDATRDGALAMAASCYALNSATAARFVAEGRITSDKIDASVARCPPPPYWPWSADWWKPKSMRRDLVRAGALILAEIERLDRLALRSADKTGDGT